MKRLIFFILIVTSLASCQEDEIAPDPALGNWSFKSDDLEFSFDMIEEYGIHKGVNSRIEHPSLTVNQERDNFMVTNPAADGGFLDLRIRSNSPIYASVWMKGVRVSGEGMTADRIEVKLPGNEYVLENQVLLKNSR